MIKQSNIVYVFFLYNQPPLLNVSISPNKASFGWHSLPTHDYYLREQRLIRLIRTW